MRNYNILTKSTCVLLAFVFSGSMLHAQTLRLTSETSDATSRNKGAHKFADLVNDRFNDDVEVKVFANATLAGGDQLKQSEMVARGDLDFVVSSSISISPLVPEMSVFSLPYLFESYEEVDAVLAGEPGRKMENIMRENGLVVLAWGDSGFRQITNSVRPIKSPTDLSGLSIRVAGPMHIDILSELGANAQQIQWTETFTSLQQGVVDGQENPIGGIIVPQRVYEVQDYLTNWNYSYDVLFLATSENLWNTWSDDEKSKYKSAAEEAMQYQKGLTREEDEVGIAYLKEQGMQIYQPTEEEIQVFRNSTTESYSQWTENIGSELVSTFEDALEAYRINN